MGKMRLHQWGTTVATSSMSPVIGPLLWAGLGSGCQGRLQTPTSEREVSLVPSCRISPCPAPALGRERRPETQHSIGGGGDEKAVWDQICRDS